MRPAAVKRMTARTRFTAGPETATIASPQRRWRKLLGVTGISPQANPMSRKAMMLVLPMWTRGLIVMWPSRRGVSSPSHNAAQPWPSSWRLIDTITQKIQDAS